LRDSKAFFGHIEHPLQVRADRQRLPRTMSDNRPTQRFSNRVDDYRRYRPHYPEAFWRLLADDFGVARPAPPPARIADIGSGTGISSAPLLDLGAEVWGVEPNAAMRAAAEAELAGNPRFHSVDGTAEATNLADASIDLALCAQAFHWFDRAAAAREFRRILRPGGRVVLAWNKRLTSGTPFLEEYERLLLEFGTDYAQVRHDGIARESIAEFLGADMMEHNLPNAQVLDYDGLRGRLQSSSYVPAPDDPRSAPMLAALRALFDRHAQSATPGGEPRVSIDYTTEVFSAGW
jgi:SAM-dependent methyltransferase